MINDFRTNKMYATQSGALYVRACKLTFCCNLGLGHFDNERTPSATHNEHIRYAIEHGLRRADKHAHSRTVTHTYTHVCTNFAKRVCMCSSRLYSTRRVVVARHGLD